MWKRITSLYRLRIFTYLLAILISFSLVGLFIFFTVRSITVNGIEKLDGLASIYGKSLLLLSESEIAENIYNRNPVVESVVIRKQYPQTLIIKVGRSVPVAYLQGADGYFALSKNSRIIEKVTTIAQQNSLPIIKYYQQLGFQSYLLGEPIKSKDIVAALQFADNLTDNNEKIIRIDITDLNMIVLVSETRKYIFTAEKDAQIQLLQLSAINKEFKLSNQEFKTLDLRFSKPIVTF